MRIVVLDTMVLASGFTSRAGTSGWLIDRWRDASVVLVVSDHILSELERTSREDRYFRVRVTFTQAASVLDLLRAEAIVTDLTVPVVGVATQPKDDLVPSTALSARASHLLTRDRQLLRLGRCQDLAIVSPGEFRALLETETADDS